MDGFTDVTGLLFSPGYVYILYYRRVCVYVGQTRNLNQRIRQHRADKHFDKILIKPCELSELDALEAHYIRTLQPTINKKLLLPVYVGNVNLKAMGIDVTTFPLKRQSVKPIRRVF